MNDKQHGGCKMDCQPSDARNCSANGLPGFTKIIIHLASIYCKTIFFTPKSFKNCARFCPLETATKNC